MILKRFKKNCLIVENRLKTDSKPVENMSRCLNQDSAMADYFFKLISC